MASTPDRDIGDLGVDRSDIRRRVIALANQKGGVGKTTTAVNLAANLAAAEWATLLIDLDPQANATSGLGLPPSGPGPTTYEVLCDEAAVEDAVVNVYFDDLWLLPSSRELIGAEVELVDGERREFRLDEAIQPVRERFDFIVVDCPPSLGLLTVNGLTASDGVIIPVQCEYYALEGLSRLLDSIERVQAGLNPGLRIEGILLTMADDRMNLSRQVEEEVRAHFGERVYETVVPRNVRLAEAPGFGKPIILYDLRSRGAQAYLSLMREVVQHGKKGTRTRA